MGTKNMGSEMVVSKNGMQLNGNIIDYTNL